MFNVSHFPKVPQDLASIVKPEELIDIVETTPLTLQDRRIFNLLLGNAWNNLFTRDQHTISRRELVKYIDSNNQDVVGSLRRLMRAIVQVRINRNRNGETAIRQVALLGTNEVETRGTEITYSFPPALIKIIKDTQIFARLYTQVMFQLSSKYSLTLYEFLQRRKNLKHISYEVLTVDEVRGILGVGCDKLKSFGHLNDKAIKPATEEVTALTEYELTAEPIRNGRAVSHIRFTWKVKEDLGAKTAAVEELERSKTGRKVRMQGESEALTAHDARPFQLSVTALEKGKDIAIHAGTGWDVYAIEEQFYEYAAQKGKPENPEGAFINFVKKKVAAVPC